MPTSDHLANRPHSGPLSTQLSIKRKTCGLVSCFRESENTHPLRYKVEQRSQACCDSVSFLFLCATFPHSTSSHGVGVSGLTPPYYHQAGGKINQYSGHATWTPPITHDLWLQQGSPQRAWQGFVCAASVCSVSGANKVLVLRRTGGEEHCLTLSTSNTINPAEEFKVAWPASDPVSGNMATSSSWAFSLQCPRAEDRNRGYARVSWTPPVHKPTHLFTHISLHPSLWHPNSWEALFLSWEVHGGAELA